MLFHLVFSFYLILFFYLKFSTQDEHLANYFTDSFYVIELFAFGAALIVSNDWFFFGTQVGLAFLLYAFAFLFQFLGHLSYTLIFLNTGIENPYLNVGDIAFLVSSSLFLVGCIILLREGLLLKGIHKNWFFLGSKLLLLLMCFTLLASLHLFTPIDTMEVTSYRIWMEFLLPVIEIIDIILLTVYLFYCNYLYLGSFRYNFLLMAVAFVVLFLNDLLFYFQTYTNTWSPAGLNDLLYLISYYLQCISIIGIANKLYRKHSIGATYYLN
jgi:hypothetical protein